MLLRAFRGLLQAIPPKNSIFDKIHFRAFKSALEIKVAYTMKSSGNFLSNETSFLNFVR